MFALAKLHDARIEYSHAPVSQTEFEKKFFFIHFARIYLANSTPNWNIVYDFFWILKRSPNIISFYNITPDSFVLFPFFSLPGQTIWILGQVKKRIIVTSRLRNVERTRMLNSQNIMVSTNKTIFESMEKTQTHTYTIHYTYIVNVYKFLQIEPKGVQTTKKRRLN